MKKGFTLIEVIVTMALISIIVVLTTSIISGNYISILKTGNELDSYYAAQEKLNRAIVNDIKLNDDGTPMLDDQGKAVRERDWLLKNDPEVKIVTSNTNKVGTGYENYSQNPQLQENVLLYNDSVKGDITENLNLLMITVTYSDINGTSNTIFGYIME